MAGSWTLVRSPWNFAEMLSELRSPKTPSWPAVHSEGIWGLMIAWVTVGHLGVTVGHFRATAGHLRVIKGPLRVRN